MSITPAPSPNDIRNRARREAPAPDHLVRERAPILREVTTHAQSAADLGTRWPNTAAHPAATPLSQSIVIGITGIFDAAATIITGLLMYALYLADKHPEKLPIYAVTVGLYALLFVQTLYAAGMYRFARIIEPGRQVPRIVAASMILFLIFLACGFILKISAEFSRVWAFGWLAISMVTVVMSRFAVAGLVRRWAAMGRIRRRIVIYGGETQGERLIRHIEELNEPWNQIVGVFDDRQSRIGEAVGGYPVLGRLDDLVDWCRRHRADDILLALPWSADVRLLEITRELAALPVNIRLSPEVAGARLVHQRTSHQFGIPMLNLMEKPMSGWSAVIKQILDLVLGSIFTLLGLPLLLLTALAIKLESPGPVFFRQQRYGFNHQLIEVFKFRTMYVDRQDAHAEQLTERNDLRITRVGAWLRRLSIDELPQLFNVLRGEMSVVGPRPHALRAKAGGKLYEDVVDEYAVRHKVKPGITGWAQVNGWRGSTDREEDLIGRVQHDLYYIDNWSVLFDFIIILRTAWVVLHGKNSF